MLQPAGRSQYLNQVHRKKVVVIVSSRPHSRTFSRGLVLRRLLQARAPLTIWGLRVLRWANGLAIGCSLVSSEQRMNNAQHKRRLFVHQLALYRTLCLATLACAAFTWRSPAAAADLAKLRTWGLETYNEINRTLRVARRICMPKRRRSPERNPAAAAAGRSCGRRARNSAF